MTFNIEHQDLKSCKLLDDCGKCKQKPPKPKKILLECGEGTGSRTFTSSDDVPFQLAFVTVDTTCINRPEVLIKFSSLVRLEKIVDEPRTVRLKYELFRTCNGEEPTALRTWVFEKSDTFDARFNTLQESFSFIFCESSNCLGCCSYFVRVTPLEITNSTAIVHSGQMVALTQALSNTFEDDYKTLFDSIDEKRFMTTHPKPKEIVLACGQGNGGILFKETGLPLSGDIAHVTIDTSCLNKPKVLIEFSSIIKLAEDIEDVILQFELFRVCGNGEPVSRGIWIFELTNNDEFINKAFSFIFCECEALSECCEYFVKVTPIEINGNENNDVTVFDARMVAMAQSSKESLNCDNYKVSKERSDCLDCKLLLAKPKEILLECGSGTGCRTFTSASEQPSQLAHVTIDTTGFCIPTVNIEFSSIVGFQLEVLFDTDDSDASVQLRYELFRTCDDRRPVSLGVWEFSMTNEEGGVGIINGLESFDFIYCDCITRPGCCDYFVTVTAVEILESPVILSVATVGNGSIAALAGEVIVL